MLGQKAEKEEEDEEVTLLPLIRMQCVLYQAILDHGDGEGFAIMSRVSFGRGIGGPSAVTLTFFNRDTNRV
jgi:hypothetical protein